MTQWDPIPGETPIDPSCLKNKSIRTRAQLNEAEAENNRKALVKYLAATPGKRLAPFDFSWMCRLHKEMFGDVWQWAGEIRQCDLNFGLPFHQVSGEILDLTRLLQYWEQTDDMRLIEQAARLHHRAVAIHPFQNGNGRWARMLANIWMRRHGPEVIAWPEQAVGAVSVIRDEYIGAVKKADNGDFAPLLDMHERYAARQC